MVHVQPEEVRRFEPAKVADHHCCDYAAESLFIRRPTRGAPDPYFTMNVTGCDLIVRFCPWCGIDLEAELERA